MLPRYINKDENSKEFPVQVLRTKSYESNESKPTTGAHDGNKNIHTARSIEESLLMNKNDENCIFLCAGSLYLVGEVLNLN